MAVSSHNASVLRRTIFVRYEIAIQIDTNSLRVKPSNNPLSGGTEEWTFRQEKENLTVIADGIELINWRIHV